MIKLARIIIVVLCCILISVFGTIFSLIRFRHPSNVGFVARWFGRLYPLLGLKVEHRFPENVDQIGRCIYIGNHQNNYDMVTIAYMVRPRTVPQKKNPDACELIRGKAGRVIGALTGMLVTVKGLPLAYNKDMQEDKEGIFDALDTWHDCLTMVAFVLEDIKVNVEITRDSALKGYSNATELADYLVAKGVPFRDSHHIVGETVVYAIKVQKGLEDLSVEEFRQFSDVVSDDVYDILSLQSCLDKRCAKGGVSPLRVAEAIADAKARFGM